MTKPHAVCEVELLSRGPVEFGDRDYAIGKVRALCELGHEPVLSAMVKLRLRDGTTDSLPAIAEATLDLNGVAVRAHASADTMPEAIDQLDQRLSRRLRRHRKRLEDPAKRSLKDDPFICCPGVAMLYFRRHKPCAESSRL